MDRDLFVSTASTWEPRPTDLNDTFFAQIVEAAPGAQPREGDVGLFGIPFDGAVLGRKGARGGPDAIRAQMARLKTWTLARMSMSPRYHDWGNVRLADDASVPSAHAAVHAAATAILDAGQVPVALGGDHSLTYPLVKAHVEKGRRVGVINLDAHLDVRDVIGGQINSGTSFGRLLEDGLLRGEDFVEVGIRDFANANVYHAKAVKAGATIISADEWMRDEDAAIDRAIEIASRNADAVYLSVDVDVLDQAHAPGVSAPTPGGVDSAALYRAIRRIAQKGTLAGADFVEVAPNLDRDNMTSRAAAYGVMHLLSELRR